VAENYIGSPPIPRTISKYQIIFLNLMWLMKNSTCAGPSGCSAGQLALSSMKSSSEIISISSGFMANVLLHAATWSRRARQATDSRTATGSRTVHTISRYTCFSTKWSVLWSLVLDRITDALMQCPIWIKLDQAHQ
jgi:hypothetical protein